MMVSWLAQEQKIDLVGIRPRMEMLNWFEPS